MTFMLDINPRNRGKTKLKFFLRKAEDIIKNFLLFLIVLLSFFYKIKSKGKQHLNLGEYVDIYSINYLVFSLSPKYIFTYNFNSSLKLIKRLGIKNFFLNCKINLPFKKNAITVHYNKKDKIKNNEIDFNFDYFKHFDEDDFDKVKQKKTIILPYYARAEFYKKNLFQKYEKFRNTKKKFQILFSGSNHPDWYEQFKWQSGSNNRERILTRCEILNFVKKEFKEDTQIIHEKTQISKIDYNKKILLIISDPSKKRKFSKILSMDEHMEFISSSKFFLTCPGTAMPLCHHIIESMFLGTVPITSYGNLLFPKLDDNVSLKFNKYSELYECIKNALTTNDDEYNQMKLKTLNYYENNLSPVSFLNNFQSTQLPFSISMNIDGHTLDERRERFGLSRLFPLPKN